jgi:hypothetical protein
VYPLLRSLDPHHARIGYLGALATVAARGLDSTAALASRLQDLLFEKIYADDPRFEHLLDRVEPARRQHLRSPKVRPSEEDPSAILLPAATKAPWIYLSELWLNDSSMPSPLGFLKRDQVERTINLAKWTAILLPTTELSEVGFILQRLLLQVAERGDELAPFNLLNPRARPSLPLLYLRQLVLAEMLFPFLVCEFVDRDRTATPVATRGADGLLRASVDRLLAAIGEPRDPADILAAREVLEFRDSIERSLSTEENYLRPRMEILVDLGLVGRKSVTGSKRSEFMWAVTDTTRRAAEVFGPLASIPNEVPAFVDRNYFTSMATVFSSDRRAATSDDERLLWFARAFQVIGRDFGFTPGRALALLGCLLAWESGVTIEVSDVFDSVYSAARSERAEFLHFSGGSRFDREFLIRLDDGLLPALERALVAGSTHGDGRAT